jgi:putative spermidine/putrescine transport system substrate-binding protein
VLSYTENKNIENGGVVVVLFKNLKKASCFSLAALLLAAVCLGGCGSKDEGSNEKTAKQGGDTLVVGTYGGKYDEAFMKAVIKKFTAETGVEVVLDPSYSYAKLAGEGKNPSVDLALMDDIQVAQGKDADVFLPLDLTKLPNTKDLYKGAVDPTGLGVSIQWGRLGLVYRTDKIKEKPTSWQDLWKDEYKGHVTINTLQGTSGLQVLCMAARLNGGDDAHLDPGWTAMKQLAANCKAIAQSTSNLTDMLTTGEVWIAPWWDGRAYALVDEGVPVDFVVPKEGAFNTNVEMIITKYSKNQEMAYKFLNAMLDAKAQAEMSSIIHYGPVNKDAKLDDQLAKQVVYGPEQAKALIICDWNILAPIKSDLSAKFDKEVAPLVGKNLN